MSNHSRTTLILTFLIILGAILRFRSITPYKIYPDAYQNLLVAKSLRENGSVSGTMGDGGLGFPPHILWSRPVYPLLINSFTVFTKDDLFSAQAVSFLAGILAIPLSYLFIAQVFNSNKTGLAAAFLTTLSFNHTVWGGFILTEAVGVFFLLLFYLSLFSSLKLKSTLANPRDFLTGVLLTFAVFTRYEYLFLAIPATYLIFKRSEAPLFRLINIFSSFFFVSSIILVTLFPLYNIHKEIFSVLSGTASDPKSISLSGMSKFFTTDLLLFVSAVTGMASLIKAKQFKDLVVFVLSSSLMLAIIYYKASSNEQRYYTHLIPLLLIPASYGLVWLVERAEKTKFLAFGLILLSIIQLNATFNGIRGWRNGEWFRVSYEEKSSKILKGLITDKNTVIVTSLPEAYFYFTGLTTQSVSDNPPHIFIVNTQRPTLVVQDMGMRTIFPIFSIHLDQTLSDFKITEYTVNEPFHYETDNFLEAKPVIIYKIF